MHDDRELVEQRIRREVHERVLPLVHPHRHRLVIESGPDLDHLEPFESGSKWGAPWATTWFRLTGTPPEHWVGRRVEAVIDLGFHQDAAGFQCEGMVVDVRSDGSFAPLQGIHPRRTNYRVHVGSDPVELLVEAASNPSFPSFRPSPLGSLETAGDDKLYRFRRAELVVVDDEYESLAHDLDVLDGFMRSLSLTDPRRPRLLRQIEAALNAVADVDSARSILEPALRVSAASTTRHHIVATGHAHIDTAWLWPLRETKRKCARTFASAVALMDDYPEYKFVCSQAQQYAWIEEQHPELFEAIRRRVDSGQWIPVGGMWVEPDMNLPSGESLVRQIVFGQRYFEEKFGARCTEVWIPDVFGYPAGLPQVFVAGGMRRFVTQKLSWNKQNRFPHQTFWWEGLDGTRVLSHFPPVNTYNAEITPGEVVRSVATFRENAWSDWSLMPFGHGDGGGGPTREMLERARRLAHVDPFFTIEVGAPSEFFEHVEHEATLGAPVPVWRGELYFEMHRGTLTSQLRTKVGHRRCERLLIEAELWAASLDRHADVDALWHEVLTTEFHDILPGSSIAWVHADAEEAMTRIEAALEMKIDGFLRELAGDGIWLANPADVRLDAVIIVDEALIDAANADDCAVQTMGDGMVAIRATAPALGMAPLRAAPADDHVVITESSMTNRHLAVRWDPSGALTSIIDIAQARELIPVGEAAGVLELAVDHPVEYDAWDLESWTRPAGLPLREVPDSIECVAVGPLVGAVRLRRTFGPSSAVVTYELRAGSRELLVHIEVDWYHDEHLLSMRFPLDVRADTAGCDVQFGVTHRPTHPSNPWDAAKFEVCAHRFVDLSEPDFGVAILNNGRYGHGVFDGAISVSLARAAKYPDPNADHGHHRVTLAVRPHDGQLRDVQGASSLLNSPPRVISGTGTAAGAANLGPVIEISGGPTTAVEIDAVKVADDGSGDLIVRLHESTGNRAAISLRARRRITEAWLCDLLEEQQSGAEVGDGVLVVQLRPFQLVTVRLRLGAEFDGRALED